MYLLCLLCTLTLIKKKTNIKSAKVQNHESEKNIKKPN